MEVQLSQGFVAVIDDADWPLVSQYRWYAVKAKKKVYAQASLGKHRYIYLHRLIMDAKPGEEIDHENGNALDCHRANLRRSTAAGNAQNRQKQPGTSSKYKGVSWNAAVGKWQARIKTRGKQHALGSFDDEELAAHAYDRAARLLFGEFAFTNDRLREQFGKELVKTLAM